MYAAGMFRAAAGLALLAAIAVVSLACGDAAESLKQGLAGQPIPETHADYVGVWQGEGVKLRIEAGGRVAYERTRGAGTRRIDAPIQRFEGADFVVGIGPLSTTFRVSEPPHQDGGEWKMTVDGVELVRVEELAPLPSPEDGTLI
jgi:hypothetical protein